MTTVNDITGDKIKTKPQNEKYNFGWELIFGKKKQHKECCCGSCYEKDQMSQMCKDGEGSEGGQSSGL